MRQTMQWSRWQSWRHALKFGVPLALIDLGIIFVVLTNTEIVPTNFIVFVVLPFYMIPYLIIPFIAGYRFYQLRHDSSKCGWAGLRVGLVSFALITFAMTVLFCISLVETINSPQTPEQGHGNGGLLLVVYAGVYGIPFALNWTGMLLAGIFGQAAGVIAEWRDPAAT